MVDGIKNVNGLNSAKSAGNTKGANNTNKAEQEKANVSKLLAEAISGKGNKTKLKELESKYGSKRLKKK